MSFFEELKRRNVVRVGIAYTVIGWVLAQAAQLALDTFGAPDWVMKSILVILLIGLPLALFFAWAFEMTPDGLKLEKDVDRSQSITPQTGRKLDRVIIGVLVLAVGLLLTDRFFLSAPGETDEIVATTGSQSIAVLPFANMSDDADHFSDGLTEELLNLLAKTPDLKVAGRTSAFAFKGRNEDLREIGDALGVNHVLEGSVRRSGDRLRITAQLIKVDDGFHLWSETYDRQMADIFDIQDDVAAAIAGALQLHLAPRERKPTQDAQAYALYLEALPYIASSDDPDVVNIVPELLNRALALDPEFAKAYESRALAYWMISGEQIDARAAISFIQESASKALELDESLTLARYFAAITDERSWNWNAEFRAAEAAMNDAPKDFDILRVWCYDLFNTGYLQKSSDCADQMIELEPLSPLSHWRAGLANNALGQRDEARANWERAADLSEGTYVWDIFFDQVFSGEYAAASEDVKHHGDFYSWRPDDIQLVMGWAQTGDTSSITAWLREMSESAANFDEENSVHYWYLAFGLIGEYWQHINRIGAADKYWLTNTEYLVQYGIAFPTSGFRNHRNFIEYAKLTALTDLWDARGAPDFCNKDSGEWVCE